MFVGNDVILSPYGDRNKIDYAKTLIYCKKGRRPLATAF